MNEQNNVEEYTDGPTGIRLTIERDIPEHPRLTVFAPSTFAQTIEELNAAIARLWQQAKYFPDESGLITEGIYAGYTPHDAMVAHQEDHSWQGEEQTNGNE